MNKKKKIKQKKFLASLDEEKKRLLPHSGKASIESIGKAPQVVEAFIK